MTTPDPSIDEILTEVEKFLAREKLQTARLGLIESVLQGCVGCRNGHQWISAAQCLRRRIDEGSLCCSSCTHADRNRSLESIRAAQERFAMAELLAEA